MLKLGPVKPNSYARPYMPPGVPRDRVRAVEAAFLKPLRDPEFVTKAEKTTITSNPIPGTTLHNMIVEGPVYARGAKEKLTPILARGEPVPIWESPTSCDHRCEFFWTSRNSPHA
jgi:hypothetical protein